MDMCNKKFLSIFLCVVLILGISNLNLETGFAEPLSGNYEVTNASEFIAAINAINNDGGTAEIVIKADITINDEVKLIKGNVTIVGDNKSITFAKKSFFITGNDTVLNLGKEGWDKKITFKSSDATSAVLYLEEKAQVNMYDGAEISDSNAGGQCGGVQLQNSSKFTMYGGLINNCKNWAVLSGAVSILDTSTFEMHGGTIQNCDGILGGAIFIGHYLPISSPVGNVGGTFIMTGGTIKECTSDGYGGGAVCVYGQSKSTVTISGGTIVGCKDIDEGYGGAIFVYDESGTSTSEIKITGGEHTGNSGKYGGFITVYKGNVEISGNAQIYNNIATVEGDDLYNEGNGSKITLSALAEGKTLLPCGHEIDGWYEDFSGSRWECNSKKSPIGTYPTTFTNKTALKAAHRATADFNVELIWDDNDNSAGKRPSDVSVKLLNDGVEENATTLNDTNKWQDKLIVPDGIEYTIEELSIPDYTVTVDLEKNNNGWTATITCKYVKPAAPPYIPLATDVTVIKTWNDNNNAQGVRPDKVKVTLLRNGTPYEGMTAELSEGNAWTYKWNGLPSDGEYSVAEAAVEGYKATITKEKTFGKWNVVVTNTFENKPKDDEKEPAEDVDDEKLTKDDDGELKPGNKPKENNTPDKSKNNDKNQGDVPKTGDDLNLSMYISLMIISLALLIAAVLYMKRISKKTSK